MNAVMNLWVSFSGSTPLYEVSFLPVQEILLQSGLDTFFMFPGSFKICSYKCH